MREAITIEYIVLLMTDSHPAALRVLHGSLTDPSVLLRLRPEKKRPGRGPGEVAVHMIPSPIHSLHSPASFGLGSNPEDQPVAPTTTHVLLVFLAEEDADDFDRENSAVEPSFLR